MTLAASSEEMRAAMRRQGIRQSELAQKLGVSQAAISYVLCGRSAAAGRLAQAIVTELGLQSGQVTESPPRCPFMNSVPVRLAISGQAMARRLAEALLIAVIANLLTK